MSSFSSGRLAVYKNTTDNKLKLTTFSSLKNCVHVEPVWFSLDNLTLCAALTTAWYCTRLKKISDAQKLFPTKETNFFIVFLKYRDTCQQNKNSSDKLEIPCGTKFLRVLIFCDFSSAKTIFLQKIKENIFPGKIYSRVLDIP